jgi:excisionase family DNA binding protein
MTSRAPTSDRPPAGTANLPRATSPPRLAFSVEEAAASIGVSRDLFDAEVRPGLRVVRVGRRVLVPVRELERYLDRHAARVLEER